MGAQTLVEVVAILAVLVTICAFVAAVGWRRQMVKARQSLDEWRTYARSLNSREGLDRNTERLTPDERAALNAEFDRVVDPIGGAA